VIANPALLIFACALVALVPSVAAAQTPAQMEALQQEVQALRESQKKLETEIETIKKRVVDRHTSQVQDVVVSIEGRPFKGDRAAKVTVVEFSDYQCPFCARHARDTLTALEADYITSGKVKYVFQDFPIASIHPQAVKAHEGAHCAGEQGKYWPMHQRLFQSQKSLTAGDLRAHAEGIGLEVSRFDECVHGGRHAATVRLALTQGKKATVRGTPTFFVGLTDTAEPTVRAVKVIRGAQPYQVFKEAIEELLATAR
jgi:protein-disulfide isomerase